MFRCLKQYTSNILFYVLLKNFFYIKYIITSNNEINIGS